MQLASIAGTDSCKCILHLELLNDFNVVIYQLVLKNIGVPQAKTET